MLMEMAPSPRPASDKLQAVSRAEPHIRQQQWIWCQHWAGLVLIKWVWAQLTSGFLNLPPGPDPSEVGVTRPWKLLYFLRHES